MKRESKTDHRRRSIRLKEYDYTKPGAYFVTMCTRDRECLFGEVRYSEMDLNSFGEIVHREWLKTGDIRDNVILHQKEFVIMPNHVHGIIWLADVGARRRRAPTIEQFGKTGFRIHPNYRTRLQIGLHQTY